VSDKRPHLKEGNRKCDLIGAGNVSIRPSGLLLEGAAARITRFALKSGMSLESPSVL